MKVRMNDGRNYDVRWERVRRNEKGKESTDTICIVSSVDTTKVGIKKYLCITVATTRQNPKDRYVKSIGRKISLDRALRGSVNSKDSFSKREREVFWETYKEKCNII